MLALLPYLVTTKLVAPYQGLLTCCFSVHGLLGWAFQDSHSTNVETEAPGGRGCPVTGSGQSQSCLRAQVSLGFCKKSTVNPGGHTP